MTSLVRTSVWLAAKDLRIELRSRASLTSALVLSTVAVVVVGLSLPPGDPSRVAVVPPLMWISTLYAALLIGDRLESIDRDDDARSWLWLTLDDRPAIFLGKFISGSLLIGLVLLWTWAAAVILLDIRVSAGIAWTVAVSGLAALSTSAIVVSTATLVSAATQRSLLLPVVTVPLLVPTSIASVQAVRGLLQPEVVALGPWLGILLVEALLFCGVGLLTYELIGGPS